MALSAGIITQAVLDNAGVDAISMMLQQYLTERAILIPSITDVSSDATKGKKSESYLSIGDLEAETKTDGTEYTTQKFAVAADQLVYDKQEGVYVELTTKGDIQSTLNNQAAILERQIAALVRKLEANVYTALANVSTASPDHAILFDTASTLSLSDIIEAMELLDVQFIPEEDRFLAVNPRNYSQILALDNFISADKYGNNMPLMTGEIGQILGFRVLKSNSVTANNVVAYHRSHVAFGRQYDVTFEQERILKNSTTAFLLETIYGLKTLDSGKRGVKISD